MNLEEERMEIKYVPTTCPYCGVGCGLNLVVRDGKLVGVEPWKRSPVNEENSVLKASHAGNSCTMRIGSRLR